MRTKLKRTSPEMPSWYRPLKIKLPYSHGLLLQHGLIHPDADGVTVLHVMDCLIRQRVIVRYRKQGLCVSQILAMLPADGIKKLRHAVCK